MQKKKERLFMDDSSNAAHLWKVTSERTSFTRHKNEQKNDGFLWVDVLHLGMKTTSTLCTFKEVSFVLHVHHLCSSM